MSYLFFGGLKEVPVAATVKEVLKLVRVISDVISANKGERHDTCGDVIAKRFLRPGCQKGGQAVRRPERPDPRDIFDGEPAQPSKNYIGTTRFLCELLLP